MGDLLVTGSARPSGEARANVEARTTPEQLSVWNPLDWGKSIWHGKKLADKVESISIYLGPGTDKSIYVSKESLDFIKKGQSEGITYTVTIDGKQYTLPKLT